MYLGNTDIALMQLAAWGKNLPSDMRAGISSRVFDAARVRLLDEAGLMMTSENKRCVRLRELGWDLLGYLGAEFHKDKRYVSDYERRVEISRILLTFWRAGYNVFGSTLSDMGASQVFVPSMATRYCRQ